MSLTCVFLLIEPKSNLGSIKNEKSFISGLMVFIVTSFCIIFLLLVLILFACCEMLFAPFRGTRLGDQLSLPLCVKYHAFRFDLRSAFSSSKCTSPVGQQEPAGLLLPSVSLMGTRKRRLVDESVYLYTCLVILVNLMWTPVLSTGSWCQGKRELPLFSAMPVSSRL